MQHASVKSKDDQVRKAQPRGPYKFAYASGSKPLAGYTIKRGVGVGGFGDVYYATSEAGKEVALKRIQRNLDVELRGVRQCLNLKHPNLVALYDIRYDDEGQAWVVMEYVAGDSLQDVIERNPNGMPLDQVEMWFQGIAQGVGYLHDSGIVHRDLKPGNIFADDGLVKIGDYGLAKFISCSRRSGQTESVGTFHYMAPEIGLGRYGKEIDIYALGVLLYEMLTGHVPFEGESSQEIIMKHLTAEPDLRALDPKFQRVVAKALAKDPEKRYRSVTEMAQVMNLNSDGSAGDAAGYNGSKFQGGFHTAQNTVGAEVPVMAEVVSNGMPEEPVARAVRDACADLKHKWDSANLNTPSKVILIAAIVFVVLGLSIPFVELGIVAGVIYSGYYVVWYLMNSGHRCKSKRVPQDVHLAQVARPVPQSVPEKPRRVVKRIKPVGRQQINDHLRDSIREKTTTRRLFELSGSMLMAAIVACVMSVFGLLVSLRSMDGSMLDWLPTYAWMSLSSVAGAWMVLILSKFWESTSGDQALRRFFMLTGGLAVGAFSSAVASGLLLEPTYLISDFQVTRDIFADKFPALYGVDGNPQPLAYMGYFGGMFALLRWWMNADPLRATRLSLMATTVTLGGAVLLHAAMPLPQGFLVATSSVVAVQLSAPWVDSHSRRKVKQVLEDRELQNVA